MSDSAINYQNILLDNLDEPININFSTPSPLNSLVTRPHIKKFALDNLKRQILTEVTQKIKNVIYQNETHEVRRLTLYLL